MKGHHHESCPRRALQQGELVVNASCVLWDSVSESTRPLGQVKIAGSVLGRSGGWAFPASCFFIRRPIRR